MTTTATAETKLRTRREHTVRAHIDAECRRDISATLATFAEANYDVVALRAPTNGAAAVEELLRQLFTAFPDFQAGPFHHGDDMIFVEVRITGTHQGEWAGVLATGRPIDVRCGCVFHFDADRLTKETVYFDHATLLAEITMGE